MTAFEEAKLAGLLQLQRRAGIGTLKERSLHAVLKYWVQPDDRCHEVPLDGFVADCFDGERVTEIQTGGFSHMDKKLTAFLPKYPVMIVYPVTRYKRLIWVDPETGETTPPRRSPKKGQLWDAFPELFWIATHIPHPGLTVRLVMVDIDEYRRLDGWGNGGKRGSHRAERLPLEIGDSRLLRTPADYAALLPAELPSPFTTADAGKLLRQKGRTLGRSVNFLYKIGAVERIGKQGNAYLYQRNTKGVYFRTPT